MNKLYKKYFHASQPTTEGYKLKQLGETANWTFAIGVLVLLICSLTAGPTIGTGTAIAGGAGIFASLTGVILSTIREVIFKCTESNIKKVFQNPKIHKYIKDKVKVKQLFCNKIIIREVVYDKSIELH